MATIRVTRELLEYALDLPPGVTLTGPVEAVEVEGVQCFNLTTSGDNGGLSGDGTYALEYEETEQGLQLVGVLPIETADHDQGAEDAESAGAVPRDGR